jgi:hypothetical protein
VPGNNSNAGTSMAAPKRNLDRFDYQALPRGARLLFAQGGAWDGFIADQIVNYNATPSEPLVFDSYPPPWGGSAMPWLRTGSEGTSFSFYQYGNPTIDGGYTVRNLRIDGQGVAESAMTHGWGTTHITFENVEITGFNIGMKMGHGSHHFRLLNSVLRNNRWMGLLGSGNGWLIEGNTFEANGDTRPPSSHAIYIAAGTEEARSITLRNNVVRNSSLAGGVCRSGNITMHGQIVGALLEGNTVWAPGHGPGCRGFSITAGYATTEYMRGVVIRNNRLVDVGGAVVFSASPGIEIDGNVVVDNSGGSALLIESAPNGSAGGDAADSGALVHRNTLCRTGITSSAIHVPSAAAISGNTFSTDLGLCTR